MIETTLQRLLKYPHAAVFDKDPLAELAIRVRHDDPPQASRAPLR